MPSRSVALAGVVSLITAFGLAGCGGGAESASPWRGEPEFSIHLNDLKLAEQASLQLSDFPSGWTVQFFHAGDEYFWPEIGRCVDFSDLVVTGESYPSDEFTPAREAESSRSYVVLFQESADAASAFERLAPGHIADCVVDKILDRAEKYPLHGILGLDRSLLSARARETSFALLKRPSHAIRVEVVGPRPFGVAGTSVEECNNTIWVDYVFIRVGRAVVMLVFRSVQRLYDPEPLDFSFSFTCNIYEFPGQLGIELAETVAKRALRTPS